MAAGDEFQLLANYAKSRDERAFAQLVDRYIDLVYASARRQVGEAELARDVTQAVFLILSQKAGELTRDRRPAGQTGGAPLSAWLLAVTRYAANNAIRTRARQKRYDQKVAAMNHEAAPENERQWEEMSPLLDEGMSKLKANDRDALLLRFFEKKTARQIGEALGISEDAAEKRVARAVDKLRDFFRRRGVAVSAVALTAGLMTHSAEAAPLGLSASVSASTTATTAATTTTSAVGLAKGTVIAMTAAKIKLVVASVAVGLIVVGGGAVAVNAVRSPTARQVKVDPTSAVQPATSAPTAALPPTPWSVTFSDGTRVDLLGVTATPEKTTGWWGADGSTVAAPQPLPRSHLRISLPPMHKLYQFVLRRGAIGSVDDDVSAGLSVAAAGSASGSTDYPTGRRFEITAAIDQGLKSVNLQVTCAKGPWDLDWRYELKAPQNPAATQPSDLKIGKVFEKNGQTQIEMSGQPRPRGAGDRSSQVMVVTSSGKEVGATSMTSSSYGPGVWGFRVPLKDAVALIQRSRPLEVREIPNVSLVPGVKVVVATQPTTGPTASR
jgi:RNA polymerase sigma factor (sigma-70 family)